MKNNNYWTYLRESKRSVSGWLQKVDAEIFGAIFDYQRQSNISGSCVEIGVHHGKSFIPLCLSLNSNERALCVDVFDDQDKNIDSSGRGDYAVFSKNLKQFEIEEASIHIIRASSEDVTSAQILDAVGPARFFSIDGGHWVSIIQNDLGLAEDVLSPDGVIALDDYCRVEWPDVTAGYHFWQNATESEIVPFAAGSNKLYLCGREYASGYRGALKTAFLQSYLSKTYSSYTSEVDCYRVEPVEQDEAKPMRAINQALKVFRPNLYVALKKLKGHHSR